MTVGDLTRMLKDLDPTMDVLIDDSAAGYCAAPEIRLSADAKGHEALLISMPSQDPLSAEQIGHLLSWGDR